MGLHRIIKERARLFKKTCMEAHMALKKLTMTKVRIVNHCSLVKEANADIAVFSCRMV